MDYIFSMEEESSKVFNEKRKNIPIAFNEQRALVSNTYTFISRLNYQFQQNRSQNNRKSVKNKIYRSR